MEMQERRMRDYCSALDLHVVEVVRDEGRSGKDLKRPGIERLRELVDDREVDDVVIFKLDRLTRSVIDFGTLLGELERGGVSLLSVRDSLDTSSASGRLVVNVMLSVSQWERETISERTVDALAQARANGTYLGKPPVGYRVENGQLVPTERYAIVERVHRLKSSGMTLAAIAQVFNNERVPTGSGSGRWYAASVARVLKAPLAA
jgi:DNA invertase Pin-like site-specific DNA recombinase